jgi:hypothetical protein
MLNEIWDRRRKLLQERIIEAAKRLLDHTPAEGIVLHFEVDGEKNFVVIGPKNSVRGLSQMLDE